ncbi:MAG: hypothetical protein MJ252_17285 [archaeon]|nr:hypothetical protein [archaeon]
MKDKDRSQYNYEKDTRDRRFKGIQLVADTFYLYEDTKELFNKKAAKEAKNAEKERNENDFLQQQLAGQQDADKLRQANENQSILYDDFEINLKDIKERKKLLKRKIMDKIALKEEKILDFHVTESNKKQCTKTFLDGLNAEEIEAKLKSVIKKKHKKEPPQLQEAYKIKIKSQYFEPFTKDDPYYVLERFNYLCTDFPCVVCSIKCGQEPYDFFNNLNKRIKNEDLNKDHFLYKKKGGPVVEFMPFKKVKILNEGTDKEEVVGALESQLDARSTLLKKDKEEDILIIQNILFEFLEGFKFFGMAEKGSSSFLDSEEEKKKCRFEQKGKMILTFLDPTTFLKSEFDEKDLKHLRKLYQKKKKEKIKQDEEKKKTALKDAIKTAIGLCESDENKKDNVNAKKRLGVIQQGYDALMSKNLGYNPVKRLFNLNAIKIQAQEEVNKKK